MILPRRQFFFILEKLLLPIVAFPLRLLVKSWRWQGPDAGTIRRINETPRIMLVTFHGMLLHLLVLRRHIARPGVVMLSPSYDGRLLAAFLKRFGVNHVFGSSRSRNIAGPLELIRRTQGGEVGLIAVDGPRGPRCVAKPGFIKLASLAHAHLLLVTSSASRGVTLKTWDRAHLPAPFAKLQLSLQLLPPPKRNEAERNLSAVQALLLSSAREIGSPVVQSDDLKTLPDA
jgi:lysophospholipid acyltransferase (LPLAT)-like uncharacterized protein